MEWGVVLVICPYEPEVHPLTKSALERFCPSAVYAKLGPRTEYWQLLDRLWSAGESFVIVEHDIEIHERVVRAFTFCPEPWCVFPYAGPRHYGESKTGVLFDQALGCTRFRSRIMTAHPDLFAAIGAGESDPSRARNWQGLDSQIAGRLRALGHEPHIHLPAVLHHHEYPTGCACGRDHD